jgi:hypothetical protein
MHRVRRSAFIVLVGAFAGQPAVAQAPLGDPSFELHQNYPNPFDESTTIPFTLDATLFSSESTVMVTVSLFDVMGQLVARPVALDHPSGVVPLESLSYGSAGRYEALWVAENDGGTDRGAELYIMELSVDGRRLQRKIVRSAQSGR